MMLNKSGKSILIDVKNKKITDHLQMFKYKTGTQ